MSLHIDLEEVLHPRIVRHCLPLYRDRHYKHSALEAMTQVELALKEKLETKGIEENRYGVFLIKNLLGEDRPSIKLRVPLGEELQAEAEVLFRGAFKYYRNYCAHDGSKVDETICIRVLILASELLDLIGASSLSFADVGGLDGLVKAGAFRDEAELIALLEFLDGYTLPDEVSDGFWEAFYARGFQESQLDAVIELRLVQYHVEDYVPSIEEVIHDPFLPSTIGWFQLTDLGKRALAEERRSQ